MTVHAVNIWRAIVATHRTAVLYTSRRGKTTVMCQSGRAGDRDKSVAARGAHRVATPHVTTLRVGAARPPGAPPAASPACGRL